MAGSKRVRIPRKARKARSGKYKFSDKRHPVKGILSFGMGILSALLTIAGITLSGQAKGQGGMLVGTLGSAGLLLAAAGFILALVSFREKEIHYRFPILGSLLNGGLTLFLVILYVLGAAVII